MVRWNRSLQCSLRLIRYPARSREVVAPWWECLETLAILASLGRCLGQRSWSNRTFVASLLDRIEGNGVRTVIVEDASRFARGLMAQELGITLLISRGVQLLTASGDDLTASDDPTRKMMRQIAGAFAEYEKARLVSKLRHARERVRQEKGKCEGRKPHGELRPEAVALAKRLHRASPKTGRRMSLRKIAAALAEAGHLNERGQPFNPKSVGSMLDQKF